jgi:hypothetical protein
MDSTEQEWTDTVEPTANGEAFPSDEEAHTESSWSASEAYRSTPSSPEPAAEGGGAMPSFLRDEIAPLLAAAEQAASQIVERAKDQARQDSADLERKRADVEARVAELVAWQQRVEPAMQSLQVKISDIQAKIEEVPDLIRRALDPVASAISGLDPTLSEISTASKPVLGMEPVPTTAPSEA